MQAITYYQYGSTANLQLEEVPQPTPREDEVLIKVHAASVNSWDGDLVKGKPYIVRLISGGFTKPNLNILGCDIAGVVEKVGKDIKHLKVGDTVMGDISESGWGGFAEYVCAKEKYLALKPDSLTFEQAAAIPQAGGLALRAIQFTKEIKPGDKVLFNGAGGGVGTMGIQIAKSLGAEVTGVDSTEKFEVMRSTGADHVIDYKQEDFTRNGKKYDRIIEAVSSRSVFDYARALNTGGIMGMVGGKMSRIFQTVLLGSWVAKNKKLGIVAWIPRAEGIYELIKLYEEGRFTPIIGKVYPLAETPQALQDIIDCSVKGKAFIKIIQD